MSLDVVKFIEEWPAPGASIEIRSCCRALAEDLRHTLETEYLGPLYRTDYSVTGHGSFPVDMLRYANSWPATEGDAHAIECSLKEAALGIEDPRTVRLSKYHRDPKPVLSGDRWQSKFHWKLVGVVETTEL